MDPKKTEYSTREVAVLLGVAPKSVESWMLSHQIQPARRDPGHNATRYWPATAVEQYRAARMRRLESALAAMPAANA